MTEIVLKGELTMAADPLLVDLLASATAANAKMDAIKAYIAANPPGATGLSAEDKAMIVDLKATFDKIAATPVPVP